MSAVFVRSGRGVISLSDSLFLSETEESRRCDNVLRGGSLSDIASDDRASFSSTERMSDSERTPRE